MSLSLKDIISLQNHLSLSLKGKRSHLRFCNEKIRQMVLSAPLRHRTLFGPRTEEGKGKHAPQIVISTLMK